MRDAVRDLLAGNLASSGREIVRWEQPGPLRTKPDFYRIRAHFPQSNVRHRCPFREYTEECRAIEFDVIIALRCREERNFYQELEAGVSKQSAI